jgi:hypothetical protein
VDGQVLITRFGGSDTYRKATPLFLGWRWAMSDDVGVARCRCLFRTHRPPVDAWLKQLHIEYSKHRKESANIRGLFSVVRFRVPLALALLLHHL